MYVERTERDIKEDYEKRMIEFFNTHLSQLDMDEVIREISGDMRDEYYEEGKEVMQRIISVGKNIRDNPPSHTVIWDRDAKPIATLEKHYKK